jgi:hypothetical protein
MADAEIESKPVDQDALVADIDRTRAELARTIDAISDRVSPKKNINRAVVPLLVRDRGAYFVRSTTTFASPGPGGAHVLP